MASFKVEIKNLNEVLKDFEQYGQKAEDAVWFGIERTAFEVKDFAVNRAPKDTTTLARGIQITDLNRAELFAAVTSSEEYSRIIELGFNGIQGVRSHDRLMTQAFGKPFVQTVTVSSHIRHVVRRPQPYMEPAAQYGQRRIVQNVKNELEAIRI